MWWKCPSVVSCRNRAVRRETREPGIDGNPCGAHRGEIVANVTLNGNIESVIREVTHGDDIVRRTLVLIVVERGEDNAGELVVAIGNTELTSGPQNFWTQPSRPHIETP